jgi:hypothetical protein
VGFITKGLSSSSLIDDDDDKLFDDIIGFPKFLSEEFECDFSSTFSCVTKNKNVRLKIHLDGDKMSRYNQQS